MPELTTLLLKLPRNQEVTPEAAKTFLSALIQLNSRSFWQKFTLNPPKVLSLEIASINQQIVFLITCDSTLAPTIETQLQSNYPLVVIDKIEDPLLNQNLEVKEVFSPKGNYYPIATYDKFVDVDPLSSVLSVLSKTEPTELVMLQISLAAISSSWQSVAGNYAEHGSKKEDGTYSPRPDKNVIVEKISYPGFKATIRFIGNTVRSFPELTGAFAVFTRTDGAGFKTKKYFLTGKNKLVQNALNRKVTGNGVLNILELATLWHLPSEKIKVTGIAWGTKVLSEPPENLPSALDATEEDKSHIAFFGETLFKNRPTIFGIKDADRRRHIWAIGKTGTGKSTLIANLAIDDLKKDRGIAIIDPHGDLCDTILNYVPSHRINDVIYFNPADREFPISINPLEVKNKEDAELVVSGLMSIFTKIWSNVWSARMEYILRNTLMTLSEVPDSTLKDILSMLTNKAFRAKVMATMKDDSLKLFWKDEFEKMPDKLQQEAISSILNKVGQFVASPMVRSIISSPKSTISLDDAMNQGKIVLVNLSQGRLGEDNAALLGATIITKFQLAAMHRVEIPEGERRDFYLYVDEFQNFATSSFIKILSEARKYRLNMMLANQYMAQIPEDVTKAILGNAGSIMTFALGAQDAEILKNEFSQVFSGEDLVNLGKFEIAAKLTIDGQITRPFVAKTLPLPMSVNQNKQKVIAVSRERWARKVNTESTTEEK
jgi:hypothetical protein